MRTTDRAAVVLASQCFTSAQRDARATMMTAGLGGRVDGCQGGAPRLATTDDRDRHRRPPVQPFGQGGGRGRGRPAGVFQQHWMTHRGGGQSAPSMLSRVNCAHIERAEAPGAGGCFDDPPFRIQT